MQELKYKECSYVQKINLIAKHPLGPYNSDKYYNDVIWKISNNQHSIKLNE